MKAKLIHQTLDEHRSFTRGGDPKAAMGVGKRAMIEAWLEMMHVQGYVINDDLTVDVEGDVWMSHKGLAEFPFYVRFGRVRGYFSCSNNGLVSLEGCPRTVDSWFACQGNELVSLEGCPEKVDGNFYCQNNRKKFTEEEVKKACRIKGKRIRC